MANFVYNPNSGESNSSQWNRYLQQREYTSDITSAIQSQSSAYRKTIKQAYEAMSSSIDNAARQQAIAVTNAANVVVGKLDQGFGIISTGLHQLDESINQIGTMLDWRLSELLDQQRISNLLLQNVALLLRIPDIQKERQYYLEQGFKHYKNAAFDADLYIDALENLLEAEKREKTDYVVLHRIGMIYLYYTKALDLEKAEHYFRKAAKYAIVETDPNAQRVLNILARDINKPNGEQFLAPEYPKMIAGESYFQAGIACYAQGKFKEAIELSSKAFSLLPSLLEAGFVKAKSIAATGANSEVVDTLEHLIRTERFYAVKVVSDSSLASIPAVQSLLQRLREEAVSQAKQRIKKCKENILPQSVAISAILEIEKFIDCNTYFDALVALDELTRKRKWASPYLSCTESLESFLLLERDERKKKEQEQAEKERQRQEMVDRLITQAEVEEKMQNRRWSILRDYSYAIFLYNQAASLGSTVAGERAKQLMEKMHYI